MGCSTLSEVYREQLVGIRQFIFAANVNDRFEKTKRRMIREVDDPPALLTRVPATVRQLSTLCSQICIVADAIEDQT
jgi:hypothetical protein